MPTQDNSRFPAAVYADTVLSVNFRDAQQHFLDALLEIHYAHTLMLERQGIIPRLIAQRCIRGLDLLDRGELASVPYDGHSEDLFFFVENALLRLCGETAAGSMHTARSRNDIDITQYRICLRAEILSIVRNLAAARGVLLSLAKRHISTLMPAYTHTQPAQPITFAHYLLAVIEILGRDERRLQAAYATVNRCPLGACAISTTGFPIDRNYTAALLGFEGLQLNSYGAISATDYLTETTGAVATAMLNLGRVTQDFLLWCTAEFGYLRLSNAWVQISSIMPQKRNPVPFEHVRVLASKALAQCQGVFTCLHNTPFGDINDAEDDLQPLVFAAVGDANRAIELFTGVMGGCEVKTERMAERAASDFLTVTELADTLVRREGVSFREAHQLVSAAVKDLQRRYSAPAMVDSVQKLAPAHFGRELRTSQAELLEALDPRHFVDIRTIPGGPAPEAIGPAIDQEEKHLAQTKAWIEAKTAALEAYPLQIKEDCSEILTMPKAT
ncbi:MAG TPA: argininosuccinate lyase [Bryobacteraceae bacterium]